LAAFFPVSYQLASSPVKQLSC